MLANDIGSIFRVLPGGAGLAAREVLERWLRGDASLNSFVTWAEFDATGRFLRGGDTDLADLSTRLVGDFAGETDLAALVAGASVGLAAPGRILSREDGERIHWYSPYLAPATPGSPYSLRGISIGERLLGDLIALFHTGSTTTPAERRVLFQLLRGTTLRAAAQEDSVSFETKRTHVKGACAKLGCAGQTDLVRLLMGHLPHLLTIAATTASEDVAIERFVREHLNSNVRLVLHRQADGSLLRTLECGPAHGRPLIVVHGMLYPLLLLNCDKACERHAIRVIMPIRSGYLDDRSTTALYDRRMPERDVDDLAHFIARLPSGRALVAGHSLGTRWAIDFAVRHPQLVSKLILISPHLARGRVARSTVLGHFIEGLAALANRPSLYRYVAWQFRKYYVDSETVRRVLRRLFETSPDDIRALEGTVGAGRVYDWFAAAYRTSIVGIAEDMSREMQNTDPVGLPAVDTTIIRGPDDPFADADHGLAVAAGAKLEVLPRGGHLVVASHADELWERVSALQ